MSTDAFMHTFRCQASLLILYFHRHPFRRPAFLVRAWPFGLHSGSAMAPAGAGTVRRRWQNGQQGTPWKLAAAGTEGPMGEIIFDYLGVGLW